MPRGEDTSRHPGRQVSRDTPHDHSRRAVPWKVDFNRWYNGQREVRVTDISHGHTIYHKGAEDYITTGNWGTLDPDLNQHLIPYREKFMSVKDKDWHVDPAWTPPPTN